MITLIGHGYVGNYIAKELTSSGLEYRWVDHQYILDLGVPQQSTFVINAAGFTGVPNVDACENAKDETINGNVTFPLLLENISPVPVLHISSGCVYTGYVEFGWKEEDTPNFTFDNASFYSASKALFQELWSQQWKHRSYIFRIRMPFGPDKNDKNLLMKLYKYPKLVNQLNSISYLPDVAKAAVHFALSRPKAGIYNAVNPHPMTTEQLARYMDRSLDFLSDDEIKKTMIAPRSNCVMNSQKMQSVFKFTDSELALKNALSFIKSESNG